MSRLRTPATPGSLRRIVIGALAVAGLLAGAPQASTDDSGSADVLLGQACMQDVAGFGLNCTANDIQIANATNITILDDGCAEPGDTVTFTADFQVLLTAQARHDIGIWFAEDGDPNGDGALSGQCAAATPAYAPDPPWLDLDGTSDDPDGLIQDTCGDIDSSHNPLFPSLTLTVTCVDDDGNGQLDLPNCTSWRQPGANELCISPLQAFPGAPSKCRCDTGFGVDIPVPGQIVVDKEAFDFDGVTPLPGDTTPFSFTIANASGGDTDLPDLFELTAADPAHASPGLDAPNTYSVTETVTPGWELMSAPCVSNQGNAPQDPVAGPVSVDNGEILTCTFNNKVAIVPPALTVVKDNDADGDSTFNDTETYVGAYPTAVPYRVSITNSSGSDCEITSITDDVHLAYLGGEEGGDCLDLLGTTLAAEATVECSFSVPFDDADRGSVTDIFTVSAENPAGSDTASDPSTVILQQTPSMTVEKSSATTSLSAPATVTYDYLLTNTGNVTLTGIALSDTNDNDDASCLATTLAPGATTTCTATHTFSQAELDANGSPTPDSAALFNEVTASSNEAPDATDELSIPIVQEPLLGHTKSLLSNADEDGNGIPSLNDTLTYQFVATNGGNITLTGVTIVDPLPDLSALSCDQTQPATLAPTQSLTCTATYVVTAADMAAGNIHNTSTADSDQTEPVDASVDVPVPQASVEVTKFREGVLEDGTMNWTFTLAGPGVSTGDQTDLGNPMNFGGALLVPEVTYRLCETNVPAGWGSDWLLNGNPVPTFDPGAFLTPPENTGHQCIDFMASAGEQVLVAVDNVREREPRTIGYWKNWNSCSPGNQAETAARNGGAAAGFFLVEDLLPITIGQLALDTCDEAVNILDKRQVDGGKKMANDAAYGLAAQLLAAKLNIAANAASSTEVLAKIGEADALLTDIGFDGTGDYLGPKSGNPLRDAAQACADFLDMYNNGFFFN